MWLPSGETCILAIGVVAAASAETGVRRTQKGPVGEGGDILDLPVAVDVEVLLVRDTARAVELLGREEVDVAALGGDRAVGAAVAADAAPPLAVGAIGVGDDAAAAR